MMTTQSFGIGMFATQQGERFAGLSSGDHVFDLRERFGSDVTTQDLFADWERSLDRLEHIAQAGDLDRHDFAALRPLPPLMPQQILCAGANYHKHVRQIVMSHLRTIEGDQRPEQELQAEAERQVNDRAATEPYMFAGLSSALCGAQDDVVLWGPGHCHDWELELGVVIGLGGANISESRAMEHVAGYTISNDVSARDVQHRPRFPMTDFLMSKNRPTYFPTGPYIVPSKFVPDPKALQIQLRVNGQMMQDESVSDIIYGVEELVAYASRIVGLQPGDLILTGSPAGNAGHHGDQWLVPGDVMEGHITGLGNQRNLCVSLPGPTAVTTEAGWRKTPSNAT